MFALPTGMTAVAGITNPTNASTILDLSTTLWGPPLGADFEYRHTFYGNRGLSLGATPSVTTTGAVTPGAAITGGYRLDTGVVVARVNGLFREERRRDWMQTDGVSATPPLRFAPRCRETISSRRRRTSCNARSLHR